MAALSSLVKVCFNSSCNEVSELPRKGWGLRSGGSADLCDRCASIFADGNFCETFHMDASGWRNCECCKKAVHCGCIVSFHLFVLLDAGGIECLNCATKSFILTPNPAWPLPSRVLPQGPEKLSDLTVKNWNSIAGSGPVPWRQAPILFHASTAQLELPHRTSYEVEMPGGMGPLLCGEQFHPSLLDKQKNEDSPQRLNIGASEILGSRANGIKYDGKSNPPFSGSRTTFSKDEHTNPLFNLPTTSGFMNGRTDQPTLVLGDNVQRSFSPNLAGKQFNNINGTESSVEAHARNVRPQAECRGKNQSQPRHWPRIKDQELLQISEDSNDKVTFLFEKILSASDAGRIGRLVLPKRSAEAHLPAISQPEGLPLSVQDVKGNEWVFQFRFWPNNNSRMYVLEGVTPCIQSLQLRAGDKVTFSRIEPEGKLILGYRKASTASPSDKVNDIISTTNGALISGDASSRIGGGDVTSQHHLKTNLPSTLFTSINKAGARDPAGTLSEKDKSAYIAKEVSGPKVDFRSKRKKNSTMALKSKRVKHENNDMIKLNITWSQTQYLFRPPPDKVPNVTVLNGREIEEYEEAPIIGRPTIFATNSVGENIQWVQCEDCFKWRKIPADALLPSRWTCSKNQWNPERSLCSADEELTPEELDSLFPGICWAAASKSKKTAKMEPDPNEDFVEGLDGLADLAIQEDGAQATSKHPRHRVGCSCIVCIQPPSGKGPKHKPSCMCNVCMTQKRRINTLLLRREQKNFEKAEKRLRGLPDDDVIISAENGNNSSNHKIGSHEGSDEESNKQKMSDSPFKSQAFDLNIQPEREEELSPALESFGLMRLLQYSSEREQRLSDSGLNRNSISSQTQMDDMLSER